MGSKIRVEQQEGGLLKEDEVQQNYMTDKKEAGS